MSMTSNDTPDTDSSGTNTTGRDTSGSDTTDTDLRSLLAQVAAGALAPDEASKRLAAESSTGATDPSATAAGEPRSGVRVVPPPAGSGSGPAGGESSSGPIQRVVVRATAIAVVLVGDPTVVGASVEGPHVARRDGGALIIDTDGEPGFGDFSYETGARRIGKAFGRWRNTETVVVKIRPELPVEVTVQAGSVVATRLEGGLRFTVEAGSLKAMECSGEIDGRVEAGSAKLDWLLDGGASQVRCELGSVKMRLDPRSNVTVKGRAELGSMELGGGRGPLVVGAGEGTLDVKVELGSAKISVGA